MNLKAIYSTVFSSEGVNTITLKYLLKPYYKLALSGRYLPIYKQVDSSEAMVGFSLKIADNSSQVFEKSLISEGTTVHQSCQSEYFESTTRFIKDQAVVITFQSQLSKSSTVNIPASKYPQGLIGLTELLIKVYECTNPCRICANSRYCL